MSGTWEYCLREDAQMRVWGLSTLNPQPKDALFPPALRFIELPDPERFRRVWEMKRREKRSAKHTRLVIIPSVRKENSRLRRKRKIRYRGS